MNKLIRKLKENSYNSKSMKKRKKLKGMTLCECLVAMMVLVICAGIVAELGVAILGNVRTSKSVVRKVNYQTPFVSANTGSKSTSMSFDIIAGTQTGTVSVDVFEAPKVDTSVVYQNYDKAGNLKFFVASE